MARSEFPTHKPLFGLTELQEHVLIESYLIGHTDAQIAQWLRVTVREIERVKARAIAKLKSQGLPAPGTQWRGSRAELRAAVPGIG